MAGTKDEAFFTTSEDFFNSNKVVERTVTIPLDEMRGAIDAQGVEQPRKLLVRSMANSDKIALDMKRWDPTKAPGDPDRFRNRWFEEERPSELIALSVYRQDGTRLFTAADAKRMSSVNPKTFARILQAAQEVNGEDPNELKLSGRVTFGTPTGENGSESPQHSDSDPFENFVAVSAHENFKN